MKTWRFAVLAGLSACMLCQTVSADELAPAKTESRHMLGFKDLEVDCAADVAFTVAPTTAVTITAPANLLPLLLTKIEGDKLVIRLKDDSSFHFLNIDSDQIKIAITGPSLRSIGIAGSADVTAPKLTGDVIALSISGSGSIHAEGATGGKVDVSVPGSGEVRVGDVEAKSVRAEVVGSGSIELAGKADSLNSEISGSGEIHADGLKVQTLKADVSGSGDLRAYASQAAEAVTSGSGNITVAGNPAQRKAREAGSGTVEFK